MTKPRPRPPLVLDLSARELRNVLAAAVRYSNTRPGAERLSADKALAALCAEWLHAENCAELLGPRRRKRKRIRAAASRTDSRNPLGF